MLSTARRVPGFTLLQLILFVAIFSSGYMAFARYSEFATKARQRTCLSNRHVLENATAMWLVQNGPSTHVVDGWFTIDNNGAIRESAIKFVPSKEPRDSEASDVPTNPPTFQPRGREIAQVQAALVSGSRVIIDVIRDQKTVLCPVRQEALQGDGHDATVEVHYKVNCGPSLASGFRVDCLYAADLPHGDWEAK